MRKWVNQMMATGALAGMLTGCAVPPKVITPATPADDCGEFHALPADVQDMLSRAALCQHYAGEQTGSEPRQSEVAAAIGKLHCDTVESDRQRLQQALATPAGRKWTEQITDADDPRYATALRCTR